MRSSRILASSLLMAGLALSAAARAEDTQPPEITHTPLEKATKGHPVRIQAKITDQSKFFPQVFYRWDGKAFEKPIDMKKLRGKKANMFEASIPIKGESLEYYIEAYDEFGNGPARAGSPESPFAVALEAPAVAAAPKKEEPKVEAAPEPPKTEEPAKPEPVAKAEPPKPEPKPVPPPRAEAPPRIEPTPPRAATTGSAPGSGRTWTWVVGGTGAGLLLGGVMTGLAFKKADDAYTARLKDTTANPATLQQQYDANKSLGTTSTILTTAGIVLVGGGVALYFFEPQLFGGGARADNDAKQDEKRVQFAASPVQGGAAAVVAGRF